MKPVISIGVQDFEFLRENGCFFIDKTDLIREWWENKDAVTLITRPRRFGKTLNLSMLNCFFSNKYKGRGELFEGLSIWTDEKYHSLQGSYPVIFFSFANIKGENFETARESIVQVLVELYSQHEYLLDDGFLNQREEAFFNSVQIDMSDSTASLALNRLCSYLSRYYGKKVLIFLDEYDTPLQEAYVYGYWEKLTSFIRGLFNSTFKTNMYLERAILTGITRVSKESIFSDLNNLMVITTTSDKYDMQFGFTQEEVFRALEIYGLEDKKEKIRLWYDGFTFGNHQDIYNPWSITCFLEEKKLKTYWVNTSSNALIDKLIREGTANIKMDLEALLSGNILVTTMDEEIIFDQLRENDNAVWSLFLAAGYLRIASFAEEEEKEERKYCLSITNLEVKKMFERMISNWFRSPAVKYNEFIKAMLVDDVDYMNQFMNEMTMAIFSSFDVGKHPSKKTEPERFYHGFVLGLLVDSRLDYKITSNRESGFGRYDVVLEPRNKKDNAYILEFKVRNPRTEKSLEETVKTALAQIEKMEYDRELIERGISKDKIRHYGFAFEGKKVLIG